MGNLSKTELADKIIDEVERTIPDKWMTSTLLNLLERYHKTNDGNQA